jgi:pimeloyl-ACP methyl ester carboxylesterase
MDAIGVDVIVCVHGMSSSKETWLPFQQHVSRVLPQVRLIALDLLGFGHSKGALDGATLDSIIDDLKQQWDQHSIGNKTLLIGHSMGGRVAVQFAATFPHLVSHLLIEDIDMEPRRQTNYSDAYIAKLKDQNKYFVVWKQ